MGYDVKILADSLAPCGKRLTTFELTYPRMVHAELMTHRLFSRNSASSRAIPSAKLIERVMKDPAMPKWWGKNQSGMQANEELSDVWAVGGEDLEPIPNSSPRDKAKQLWLEARDSAVRFAERLTEIGLHKQIANRIVEPWMFITVILSATEFDNWEGLRDSAQAQPEIAWTARGMKEARKSSAPEQLPFGAWHMPLIRPQDVLDCCSIAEKQAAPGLSKEGFKALVDRNLRKLSVARCARVSYLTHDGVRDLQADFDLHDRLAASGHWSPFEHVAMALNEAKPSGNFIGWHQYRKDFENEHIGGRMP